MVGLCLACQQVRAINHFLVLVLSYRSTRMKLVVVNKLLINRGWRLITKTSRLQLLAPTEAYPDEHLIVLPVQSTTPLPTGTLDSLMRRVNQTQSAPSWPQLLSRMQSLELIIEKSADVLWGRVSLNGLFLVVRGNDITCLTTQILAILPDLMVDSANSCCGLPETLSFDIRHDMTELWSFLRQLRANYIADLSGIDLTTINRFISGKEFPSPKQTIQLQQSFQELSNQLLRLSG